jgi:hypothetical protein
MSHLDITNIVGNLTLNMSLLLSFMTCHQVCNKSNMTGVAGTAYPSGAPEFTPGFFVGFVLLNLLRQNEHIRGLSDRDICRG